MAKVPKYDRHVLDGMEKSAVVAAARGERDADRDADRVTKVGALNRAKTDIINDLMKYKIPAPAKDPPGAQDPRDVARERKDELTKELAALRIAHPEDDDHDRTRSRGGKVAEPVKLQAKPTFSEYKTWKRAVQEWMIGNSQETDACLCTYFLKAINDAQRDVAFSVIPKGKLTCTAILEVLDDEYVGDDICHGQDIHDAFRGCRRAGRALSEYVREWKQLRRKAMIAEVIVENPASDFQDLMRHAELTEAQGIQVLGGLRSERRMHLIHRAATETFDQLESVFSMLKDIERAVHQTTGEAQGRGRGRGRRGGGDGGGCEYGGAALVASGSTGNTPKTPCGTCGKQHTGVCWHAQGGSGAKSRGKGKKNSHKQGKGKGKGKGAKGAKDGQFSSDWKCSCGYLVFGRIQAQYCSKCGKQKPAGAGVPTNT